METTVVTLDPQQLDLILMWLMALACSISFCIGFSAHKGATT